MSRKTLFCKILSLAVIIALFSMRVSHLSESAFVIPVEDAIFHVAFIAAEESPVSTKILKIKGKTLFDIVLTPNEEIFPPVGQPRPSVKQADRSLIFNEISAEIFIPPEIVS